MKLNESAQENSEFMRETFNCLALDLGATSSRLVRGVFEEDKLVLNELYRFPNRILCVNGHDRWDVHALLKNVLEGLVIAATGKQPLSIGVDSWGVDFVLLNSSGEILDQPVAYRDSRTKGLIDQFSELIPKQLLFNKTGIAFMEYNTLYQLIALLKERPDLFSKSTRFQMIPDYFNYMLSGSMVNEFTAATTTQMLCGSEKNWDEEILSAMNLSSELFSKPVFPGHDLGFLREELWSGSEPVKVIAVGSHDTASAVAALPACDANYAYLCTGTWWMMGIEVTEPLTSPEVLENGFSNEGAVGGGYRLLKNLMGLWIVNSLKKELKQPLTYEKMEEVAIEAVPLSRFIYPNDPLFFNPASMKEAFNTFFRRTGQTIPVSDAEYLRCAYESLAMIYKETLTLLKRFHTGGIDRIHALGGGIQSKFMCQLTADSTGIPLHAGPREGSVLGNLIVQAVSLGKLASIQEGRALIKKSFPVRVYSPRETEKWDTAYAIYKSIKE